MNCIKGNYKVILYYRNIILYINGYFEFVIGIFKLQFMHLITIIIVNWYYTIICVLIVFNHDDYSEDLRINIIIPFL